MAMIDQACPIGYNYGRRLRAMKGTRDIVRESGLSKGRVNQFARAIGVAKVGEAFIWNEEQEKLLYSRIGQRGKYPRKKDA